MNCDVWLSTYPVLEIGEPRFHFPGNFEVEIPKCIQYISHFTIKFFWIFGTFNKTESARLEEVLIPVLFYPLSQENWMSWGCILENG